MKNMRKILVLSLIAFLVIPQNSRAEEAAQNCRVYFNNDGYFFKYFEEHEYGPDGFLILRFKLKTPYNDGRGWMARVYFHQSSCATEVYQPQEGGVSITPGIQNYSFRFTSRYHYDIWNDEHDVKIECPGCSVDIPEDKEYDTLSFSGSLDGGASIFHSSSFKTSQEVIQQKLPIVIVPGLLGTELHLPEEKVWPNLLSIVSSREDNFMDHLAMEQDGDPLNQRLFVGPVLESINYTIGTFHYADNIVKELEQRGYKKDKDLFLFNYDWRRGVPYAAEQLKQKLEQIQSPKVGIIAHSLGGLVVKYVLAGSGSFDEKISSVIMVGVPNLGSAKAAEALIFGSDLGIPFLNSDKIFNLVKNMQSMYDLLPTREYFRQIPGYYDDLSLKTHTGILDYEQSKSLLTDLGKNTELLSKAESLHVSTYDLYDFSSKPYTMYNIVGCGTITLQTIMKMYSGNPTFVSKLLQNSKYKLLLENGDGTILLKSANFLKNGTAKTFYSPGVRHNQMLAAESSLRMIMTLLENGDTSSFKQNPDQCTAKGKLVNFPRDTEIVVKDKEDKVLTAGLDYEEYNIGEREFVSVPDDGNVYTVEAKPQEVQQPISFSVTRYGEQSTTTNNYSNVKTNNLVSISLPEGAEEVEIIDGGGVPEVVVPDNQGDEREDEGTPPETRLETFIQGRRAYRSILKMFPDDKRVKLIATDASSGVRQTLYSYDNGLSWEKYNVTEGYIDIPLGLKAIQYFSEDNVGNIEDIEEIQFSWQSEEEAEEEEKAPEPNPKPEEPDKPKPPKEKEPPVIDDEDEEEGGSEEEDEELGDADDGDGEERTVDEVVSVKSPEGIQINVYNNNGDPKPEADQAVIEEEKAEKISGVIVKFEPFYSYFSLLKTTVKLILGI